MAKSSRLKIMISSRCMDKFDGTKLSEIRWELKNEIEGFKVFGRRVFDVWINEAQDPKGGNWDSWEVCLKAVQDCDILIVLFNGSAGWAKEGGEIGICHAELMEGLTQAPGKVRMIELKTPKKKQGIKNSRMRNEEKRNSRFKRYYQTRSPFRGEVVETVDALKASVKGALLDAVISLTQEGIRAPSMRRFDIDDALSWSRLNFESRERKMRNVLRTAILERKGSERVSDNVVVRLKAKKILLVTHAIPAALSVGPAIEMVGQPFLRDHKFFKYIKSEKCGGPVHIIACQKTATEAQAIKLLGFPDATVIATPFGVFVADNIQKVQFAFIVNCRDETTTRHGAQRFFEWLAQTGEDQLVVMRAKARAKIVHAIVNASPTKPGRIQLQAHAIPPKPTAPLAHRSKPNKKHSRQPSQPIVHKLNQAAVISKNKRVHLDHTK